jgi:hypothetical protein
MRWRPAAVLAGALAGALFAAAGPASAQAEPPPALRPGHLVVGVGGSWVGADQLGSVRAETRASAVGTTSPPPSTFFDTSSRLDGAPAADVTLTMAATRRRARGPSSAHDG